MLNKFQLLMGAYYCKNVRIAQVDEFFEYLNDDGSIVNSTPENKVKFLEKEISKYKEAYNSLDKYQKDCSVENFDNIFNNIIECFYSHFNILDGKKPKIKIVDIFPHPFEKTNYKAIAIEKLHEKEFNIPEGIYLLKKYAIHGIAEIMMAHEVMHYIFYHFTNTEDFMPQEPFLSEGIVDFTSLYLLLKYNIIDDICIKNWISFGRANCTNKYIGNLYFNELKQLFLISKRCGIEEIIGLINNGMKNIASIDMSYYLNLENRIINDNILTKFISYFDNAVTNINLNIDEYYVLKELLGICNGIPLSKVEIKYVGEKCHDDILKDLSKKGLIYIDDEILYCPNFVILNTIKVILE